MALIERFDFLKHTSSFHFALPPANSCTFSILDKTILVLWKGFPHLDELLLVYNLDINFEVPALDFVPILGIVCLRITHGPLILRWSIFYTTW